VCCGPTDALAWLLLPRQAFRLCPGSLSFPPCTDIKPSFRAFQNLKKAQKTKRKEKNPPETSALEMKFIALIANMIVLVAATSLTALMVESS